jgi:hypothetical protein
MPQQDQEIDRERRILAQKLLSDLFGIPNSNEKRLSAPRRRRKPAKKQVPLMNRPCVAKGSVVMTDATVLNLILCAATFFSFISRICKSPERIGPLDTNQIARSPQLDDNLEEERSLRPPAKRARRERAFDNNDDADKDEDDEGGDDDADMQDAPPVEEAADDVETAESTVKHYMRHTMNVEMLNQSFEHFEQTEMSHEGNGKVSLVFTDPPCNTQRYSATARGGHREI